MAGRRDSFSKRDVTVTMTGEEWFAVLCRLSLGDQSLSPKGLKVYQSALGKLQSQVSAASYASLREKFQNTPPPGRPSLHQEGGEQ